MADGGGSETPLTDPDAPNDAADAIAEATAAAAAADAAAMSGESAEAGDGGTSDAGAGDADAADSAAPTPVATTDGLAPDDFAAEMAAAMASESAGGDTEAPTDVPAAPAAVTTTDGLAPDDFAAEMAAAMAAEGAGGGAGDATESLAATAGVVTTDGMPADDFAAEMAAAMLNEQAADSGTGEISQDELDAILQASGFDVSAPLPEIRQPAAAASSAPAASARPNQPVGTPFVPPNLDPSDAATEEAPGPIELINDVMLDVRVELGRANMYVEDVLALGSGSVVELEKLAGDPVEVFVNERLVARGEVLVLNDDFCVRISEIISPVEQLSKG
jgi:flagellar motor switch protein FliN/FliY